MKVECTVNKMEEHANVKLMQGDCLSLLKLVASDFFRLKITKVLLWLNLFIHISVTALSAYYSLYIMDKKEFIYYAPIFFASFYLISAQLVLLFKNDLVANIKDEMSLWTIDSAGEKIYKKLKFEIFIINMIIAVLVLLSFVGVLLHLLPLKSDREFVMAIRIFEDFFPNQKTILWRIYKATYPLCGYSLIAQPFQFIYYTQHIRFQFCMFIEKLLTIAGTQGMKICEEEIYYDQTSQKQIQERLIFVIRRFQQFVNVHNEKNKETYFLLALYSICAFLMGTSILIFVLSGKFYTEFYPRIGIIVLIAGILFVFLLVSGQSIEDQVDTIEAKMAHSNMIGWYNYNPSNKKLYMIFLINVLKPRKIKISENYAINYRLGLAILRSMYSVITVIVNIAL